MSAARALEVAQPPCLTPRSARLAALFEEQYEFVWRTVRRLGVPEGSVDDAAQEVFLVVHRRLDEYKDRGFHRAWLTSIAVRVASEHRRRCRRKEDTEPLSEDTVAPGAGPHEAAVRSEALAKVYRLLAALDEAHRSVFVLAEMEQMTAPEIAQALGIKLNTVYSRLRVARERFEAGLAEARRRGEL